MHTQVRAEPQSELRCGYLNSKHLFWFLHIFLQRSVLQFDPASMFVVNQFDFMQHAIAMRASSSSMISRSLLQHCDGMMTQRVDRMRETSKRLREQCWRGCATLLPLHEHVKNAHLEQDVWARLRRAICLEQRVWRRDGSMSEAVRR